MRISLLHARRSADKAGGGIWAGVPLIIALLFASTELAGQALTVQATLTNVQCFGTQNGSIDLSVSGGQAPYDYEWSNGATTEDLADLPAGFYAVFVKDGQGNEYRGEYTLTEPEALGAEVGVHVYPNGRNLSCYQCSNGSITIFPQGGTAPYSYFWQDGALTQHRYNLGAVQTSVTITDARGCTWNSEIFTLTSPESEDWKMAGNAGTNPATHYLGTSDNKDLVFKANGTERLSLLSTGDLKLTLSGLGVGPLYRDANGILRSGIFVYPDPAPDPVTPCAMELDGSPYWKTDGNGFLAPQCDDNVVPVFGTTSANPIKIITNNETRMWFGVNGKVMIGETYNDGPIGQYRLYVDNGIATRDVQVKLGTWPDFVFADAYHLMPLEELRAFVKRNNHLPGIPSAKELEAQGGVEVGDMQRRLVQVAEEQALYILQLEEKLERQERRMQRLEQRLRALEASK